MKVCKNRLQAVALAPLLASPLPTEQKFKTNAMAEKQAGQAIASKHSSPCNVVLKKWMRRACRYLGLSRASYQYRGKEARAKDKELVKVICRLSKKYPRYGYRRIRALACARGLEGEPQARAESQKASKASQ